MLLSFSYDAAEDNEISFKEGDRITDIEAASDEWWQGKDKHGNVGLFPGMSCSAYSTSLIMCTDERSLAAYVALEE